MSRITFSEQAWEDYIYWQSQDKKTLKKINALLKDIGRQPFEGEGKPERLRGMENTWSRRINGKDRLVYVILDGMIYVLQCRGHYDDP